MTSNNHEHWLWYSVRRSCLDKDLEKVSSHMRGDVLEIGAGRTARRGSFNPPIDAAKSWCFVDIDPTRKPDLLANIQSLPFSSEQFDTIICLEVLEYVQDVPTAIDELHRVLKEEGRLILSVPFLHRCDAENDLWRFTLPGLQRILTLGQFNTREIYTQGTGLAVAANILKNGIYAAKTGRRRTLASYLTRPFIAGLWAMSSFFAERIPVLGTYSTGYLIVADKNKGGSQVITEK